MLKEQGTSFLDHSLYMFYTFLYGPRFYTFLYPFYFSSVHFFVCVCVFMFFCMKARALDVSLSDIVDVSYKLCGNNTIAKGRQTYFQTVYANP